MLCIYICTFETLVCRFLLAVDIHTREVMHKISVDGQIVHRDGITAMYFVGSLVSNNIGLLTIGSKITKDLAAWDVSGEVMLYKVQLEFFVDLIQICQKTKLAVCGNTVLGYVTTIDLRNGDIVHERQVTGLIDIYLPKSSTHVLLATRTKGIIVMRLSDFSDIKTICLPRNTEELTKIAVDPYEYFIVGGYRSGLVNIYLVTSGLLVTSLMEHQYMITGLFCWNQVQVRILSLFSTHNE